MHKSLEKKQLLTPTFSRSPGNKHTETQPLPQIPSIRVEPQHLRTLA